MSTDTQTASDDATTDDEPTIDPEASIGDDSYRWLVSPEDSEMAVGKVSYSTFEFTYGPASFTFDGVRHADDGGYSLRDGGTEIGTLDPSDDGVPSDVAVALAVLAEEL